MRVQTMTRKRLSTSTSQIPYTTLQISLTITTPRKNQKSLSRVCSACIANTAHHFTPFSLNYEQLILRITQVTAIQKNKYVNNNHLYLHIF